MNYGQNYKTEARIINETIKHPIKATLINMFYVISGSNESVFCEKNTTFISYFSYKVS